MGDKIKPASSFTKLAKPQKYTSDGTIIPDLTHSASDLPDSIAISALTKVQILGPISDNGN
jgi:hypothetical protein